MVHPSPAFRTNRRLIGGAVALVILVVAVVAGVVLRSRSQTGATSTVPSASGGASSTASSSGGASSTGAASPSGSSGAGTSASAGSGSGTGPTCAPGQTGPLRQDTEFTATDGSGIVVKYSISLPAGYYDGCEQYPVIYGLHGKGGSNVDFLDEALTMREAMDAGVLDQSIIVTADSFKTGRWENRDEGPAEDNLINRLLPYIDQNYRVRPGASNRLLVGFSMGGHGAIRFGLKYPNLWAAVWSVDGAMAGSDSYYPFIEGKTSGDFQILAMGGQLNGSRVETLINDLKARGVDIPYTYQDLEHTFVAFVAEDKKLGWPAMSFLQKNLGRTL